VSHEQLTSGSAAGIIDPTEVVRPARENAVSVAEKHPSARPEGSE
jgi:hypothetical protein